MMAVFLTAGCHIGQETDFSFPLRSVPIAGAYLKTIGENSLTNPALLLMAMELRGKNSLQRLLGVIGKAGKYVDLDLSRCTMAGTEFDPDYTQEGGKDLVVSLILPDGAKSIRGAGKNAYNYAVGTFEYFTSLKRIRGRNIESIGAGAFYNIPGGCRHQLTMVDFPALKDIGYAAFMNCEIEVVVRGKREE
jgi:hypothetical protein